MDTKIDLRPRILEIIQKNGPVIPREVVKEVGGDTFIVGAVLMQLKDSGKIFVSNTKVGGSPAYFCEGQEERLQTLEKYLNENDRYSFNLLKEKKILRDYDVPTHVRLSLRVIKDFSIPLVVSVHGQDEIFWKWYMTSLSEAEDMVKEIILTIPIDDEEKQEDTERKELFVEENINEEKTLKKKEKAEEELIISNDNIEIYNQKDDTKKIILETYNEQEIEAFEDEEAKEKVDIISKIKVQKDHKPQKVSEKKRQQEHKIKEKPKIHKIKKKEMKARKNKSKNNIKEKPKKWLFKKILDFFR